MSLKKYCIQEKLESLPLKEYRLKMIQIPLALKKSKRTFERYCALRIEDYGDISAVDLDIIASCLDCSPNELKNYVVIDRKLRLKTDKKSTLKSCQ